MKRTKQELAELHAIKANNGKRFYVAAHWYGSPYVVARFQEVGKEGSFEYAIKYFKAQHRQSDMFLCECVCNVSRYGNVTYGAFAKVSHDCNR